MRAATLCCFAALLALASTRTRGPAANEIQVSSVDELVRALSAPGHDMIVRLAPGVYTLTPAAAVDSSCGNCAQPDTLIPVTVGLVVSGRSIHIVGPEEGEAVIVTRAGYGIYFDDCVGCSIERLTVTGGERGSSDAATDAAIVTKHSLVTISDCVIADNAGMGICAREGSVLDIQRNEIRDCSGGIALYRATDVTIHNNLVEGDGAGIAAAWSTRATIERNYVRGCAEGIAIRGDADVIVRANLVENVTGRGISVRDGSRRRPRAVIEENVVYDCGGPGLSIQRRAPYAAGEAKGKLVRNIVVQIDPGRALELSAVPDGFVVTGNAFYDNRDPGDSAGNLPREMFWRERRGWTRTYRNTEIGVGGRHRFHQSAFLTRYGRWFD